MIAGIADIARPAHKLSVRQSVALAATGRLATNVWCTSLNLVLNKDGLFDLFVHRIPPPLFLPLVTMFQSYLWRVVHILV